MWDSFQTLELLTMALAGIAGAERSETASERDLLAARRLATNCPRNRNRRSASRPNRDSDLDLDPAPVSTVRAERTQ